MRCEARMQHIGRTIGVAEATLKSRTRPVNRSAGSRTLVRFRANSSESVVKERDVIDSLHRLEAL